ncbi:MAG: PAS domain S-box protein [Deltaproteobacteria bacterium]|nr:PAS domain S-box protein [Deltaproteobacteria bacterium]
MSDSGTRAREPWANRTFLDLLEAVPDAMIVVEQGGGIVLANSRAETLFGYSRAELSGRVVETLMPEHFRAAHEAMRAEYVRAPRPRPLRSGLELYALRKDGLEIPVDIGLSTLSIEAGTFVIASIRDSTARRLLEQALRERNVLIAGDLDAEVARRTGAEAALQRASERLSLLHALDLSILRAQPPEEVARHAAARLRALIACERVSIFSFDPGLEQATLLAADPAGGPGLREGVPFPLRVFGDVGAIVGELRCGRVCEVDLDRTAPRTPEVEEILALGKRHHVLTPLLDAQTLMGILSVGVKQPGALSPAEREICIEVGALLATALHQERQRQHVAESEARYRGLFEQIPVGVARATPDGRLLDANPAYAEMFGFPDPDSMKGVPIPDLYVDPQDRDRVLALVREGDLRNFETQCRRRDGSIIWVAVNLRLVRDPGGQARSLDGVVIDVTARKRAEEESRRSELTLRKAQEIARVGSCDWDIGADTIRGSDEFYRIFGFDPRQSPETRDAFLDAVHPADRDRIARVFDEALKGREKTSVEYRVVLADGTERTLHATGEVFPDSLGRPSRWIGAVWDVTERKRAEEARARLAAIVESSNDAISARDLDGIVTSWNQAAEHLYGFTAAEMVGQTISRVVPAERGHETAEIIRRITGGERVQHYETERLRKDGTRLIVSLTASPIRDDAGRLIGIATISRDVTERKLAEQALAERARLAQFAAEIGAALTQIEDLERMLRRCAEIMVARLDAASARFWTLNEEENVLELRASAGMYMHVDGLHRRVPVGDAKIGRIASERRPHLTNSVVGDPEVREWARRAGMVAFAGYPLLVDGRVLGVMAMFARRPLSGSTLQALASVDQSIALAIDNRRSAAALRAALRRAEESDRLKTAFLANVTHEIRTPLNVILGFADVIAAALPAEQEPETRSALSAMTRASDRLLRTIDGVLDAAMLEAGTYRRRPEPVALAPLIEQQLRGFERQMRDKGLTWSAEVEEPGATLRADEHGLRTVLHHLLSNAVKFTAEGGIAVRLARDGGGALTIEVRDTGVGIDPAFAARLFQPFSQEDPSSTRRYEGPGIGLALCKRFLDLQGAAIRVSTEKGRGTTFAIRFDPAGEPRAARRSPADDSGRSGAPGAALRGRRVVLAVENDPDSQRYVQTILKDRFTVLMAASAPEAFALLDARGHEIGAALLDIALGGPEDGLAVARHIRESEALQRIAVIATTAHVSPDDRRRSLAAGCDDYPAKPFSPEALLATLEAHGLTAPAAESIQPAAGASHRAR